MLPDIRAVIAAMAAAVTLLVLAFGVTATLRVAQESRAGYWHADLTQRGHAAVPEPQPVAVIETPGPTLLVQAPEVDPLPPAVEQAAAPSEPPNESEAAPQSVAVFSESPAVAAVSAEPDFDKMPVAEISPAAPESAPIAAIEPAPEPPMTIAALLEIVEPPSPAPVLALGGPSPEEIAQAKAQRKAAERARARKAEAEKRKKARAARIARARKLAAQQAAEAQARQQASAPSQPGGFGFAPAGSFSNAPFGNTFGATSPR